MKVYKDFYASDMYELLEQAYKSGYLSKDCVDSDLAILLTNFMEEVSEEPSENYIYDFIRFDMEIQTESEIVENYSHLLGEKEFQDIEDFLSYYTLHVGNFESNGETCYVFTSF